MALPVEVARRVIFPAKRSGDIIQFKPRTAIPEGLTANSIGTEQFLELNGFQREGVLLSLIEENNLDKVNELRPDMNALEPLDMLRDDRRLTSWVWKGAHSPTEITSDNKEGYFRQLNLTFPFMGQDKLSSFLERERQRTLAFAPGMFTAEENLGKPGSQYEYTAARRYFTVLSEFVRSEKETRAQAEKRIRMGNHVIVFDANPNPKNAPTPLHF